MILRSPLDGPVDVLITSENGDIARVEPEVVTSAAGRVTASFEVIGIASGETTVIVEVPDLGASVEVPVTVRGEQRDLELNWRPDHINLGTDQGRRVILALSQPATEPLEVVLELEEGEDGSLFFLSPAVFEPGDRHILVGVESGEVTGQFKLRATLSDGVSDVLEVKVRSRSDRELDREREKDSEEGDDDNRGGDGVPGDDNNRGRDGVDGDDDNNEKDGEEGDDNSGSGDDESDGDEGDDNSGSGG